MEMRKSSSGSDQLDHVFPAKSKGLADVLENGDTTAAVDEALDLGDYEEPENQDPIGSLVDARKTHSLAYKRSFFVRMVSDPK